MTRALPIACAAVLTGCAPFGPNLTGRWTGTCADREGIEVVLELADRHGALEGDGVVTLPRWSGEAVPTDFLIEVEGERTGTEAVMDVESPLGVAQLDGYLDRDVFTAELGGPGWYLPPCDLDLER